MSGGSKGLYSLMINAVESRGYYLMYQSPEGYRISGNTLPLERSHGDDLSNFECIPLRVVVSAATASRVCLQ